MAHQKPSRIYSITEGGEVKACHNKGSESLVSPNTRYETASRKATRVQDFRACLRNLIQRKNKRYNLFSYDLKLSNPLNIFSTIFFPVALWPAKIKQ
jgi:hypothetical protein